MTDYQQFLSKKHKKHVLSGFDAQKLNENLFPFQEFIVKKALKAGKYAIFADCGLGKTLMQLSWAEQVINYTNKQIHTNQIKYING